MKTTSSTEGRRGGGNVFVCALLGVMVALAMPATARADEPSGAAKARPGGSAHSRGAGLGLPGGILINGKFDLNYERRGYTDSPSDGDSALANYHHFLFISRHSPDDPLYFSAEVVDLTFYYVGGRYKVPDSAWTVSAEAGKIMVPFGPDPLFHHNYGGLSGIDQAVLPAVWALHGVSGSARYGFDRGNFKLDLYTVQGYALGSKDGGIDLRVDQSPSGDIEMALGFRAGFSYGPATIYYSLLYNDVGFDQHLVAQALDVTLHGIPGVTVLQDMTLSLGFLRADRFGGTPASTYEFADYLELRYRPSPHFFLWYRGGLRTRDNQSGVFYDDDDVGPGDESAHSIGVGARFHGLSVRLSHTWRLEKDVEEDNDFIRLGLTYDF